MSQWTDLVPLALVLLGLVWVVHVVRHGKRTRDADGKEAATDRAPGSGGRWFERLCWVVTMVFAALGAMRLMSLAAMTGASAPQYAAEAAGVCASVVVPYVFTRAVSAFRRA